MGTTIRNKSTYSTPSGGPIPTGACGTGELLLLWKKNLTICWWCNFCLWNLWSVKVDSRNSILFLHLLLVLRAMPRVELASRQKKKRSRKTGEATWCCIFSTAMWYYDIMNTHIYLLTINWLQSFLVCCEITFTVNLVPFLLLWTMFYMLNRLGVHPSCLYNFKVVLTPQPPTT